MTNKPEPGFLVKKDFHLKEYESLKQEISELVEHSRRLEVYAVGALGAFYAWYIGTPAGAAAPRNPVALTIPLLVAILGAWRSWTVLTRLNDLAEYLRRVESVFAVSEKGLPGWETYLKSQPGSPFLLSAIAFWATLVLVASVALCVLHWKGGFLMTLDRLIDYLRDWRFWLGVSAFIYGMIAVFRFATGRIERKPNGELSTEAIAHVMIWTFVPPIWFFVEHVLYAVNGDEQKLAGNIWAAVLAAILFLLRK